MVDCPYSLSANVIGRCSSQKLSLSDLNFKISSFKYDPAGHVGDTNTVYYKIPITQTEQDVLDLQEAVGVPADKAEDGVATGLFAVIDKANENISKVTITADTVNDQLGSYSDVFPETGIYTLSGEEGNVYKDFYSAFGNMDAFRSVIYEDSASSKTLIEGILKMNQDLKTQIENNNNILTVYAKAIDNLDAEIKRLKEKIEPST